MRADRIVMRIEADDIPEIWRTWDGVRATHAVAINGDPIVRIYYSTGAWRAVTRLEWDMLRSELQ